MLDKQITGRVNYAITIKKTNNPYGRSETGRRNNMADIKIEVEYGGYSIRWVDYDRTFDLYRDDVKVKGAINTVQSCKEWIDGKNKRKYRR